jgi:hypothetical protein
MMNMRYRKIGGPGCGDVEKNGWANCPKAGCEGGLRLLKRDPGAVLEVVLNIAVVLVLVITVTV